MYWMYRVNVDYWNMTYLPYVNIVRKWNKVKVYLYSWDPSGKDS